ncbi:hypothetical protein Tco_0737456 [Tanacetum coccineum]
MGRIPLVRLELELRGFKAWILFFTSALGTSIVSLDQPWDSIVELGRNGEGRGLGGDKDMLWGELARLEL